LIRKFFDIKISGKHYSYNDILDLANNKMQNSNLLAWELSLYKFILEWISDTTTVKVKTSGSTGKPKTINLEKEKMIESAMRTGSFLGLKRDDKALLCLPADFIAGKMMVVRAFVLGLNLFPVEPASNPLDAIDEKFDFAAMTPMQVSQILEDSNGKKKLGNIEKLIIGGGEVDRNLAIQIASLQNQTWNTYGMTETITHVALKKLNNRDITNYFKAIPGVHFEKDSRECLVINAPHLSSEPFVTNDIVDLISKTEFEFIGRHDFAINSGGIKLHPETIEAKLRLAINQRFAIVGVPDEKLGQKVVLAVEGKNDEKFCPDYNAVGLSKYEFPKEIIFIDKIPLTENGKINRKQLYKSLYL
jgi:O-succinylbenzoic acid--CoA ligase